MSTQPSTSTLHQHNNDDDDDENIREIHALTPQPPPQPPRYHPHRGEVWETTSHRSSNLSVGSNETENFTTMSREFNALVLAGNDIDVNEHNEPIASLERIREEEINPRDTNPLAIVADNNPRVASPTRGGGGMSLVSTDRSSDVSSVQRVKKEEVESKISAWQNSKIAKINNRFKREDAIINGWESEQVQKSTSWMKKVERKLEEKRAKALEKMQNDVAKAKRKAEERRATAEAKRGTKVARVLEIANLMRAVGRAPTKRSFF
ncbi:putative remorin [Helianthus annuus]|nr:putative remorin [Helianthus annuus]KAJ0699813.1 putative remorin [Helianthus annuus]KAJ0742974.1 putative remorin [Helianthus annuus]KAJ0883218.1 putative remorin [Helianthus annuus]